MIVRALLDATSDATAWIELLRKGSLRVLAPDLVYAETGNAFVKEVRGGGIELERAIASLSAVMAFPVEVRESRRLCALALPLAVDAGLTAYDAHYLALAEAEDAVLVTADRGLAAAASRGVLLE